MLGILQQCRLVNDHEVDFLACSCLHKATDLLICTACAAVVRLAVIQVNGSIETALWYLLHNCKGIEYLFGFRGIHRVNHVVEGRRDEQVSVFLRYLVLIHFVLRLHQSRQNRRTIRQCACGCLGNACCACVGRKAEGIHFGDNLRADEFRRQLPKGKPCGFLVVHGIDRKFSATVIIEFDGFIRQCHIPMYIAAVAVIIRQTVHADFGNHDFVCVCAHLHQCHIAVQCRGDGRILIDLVQQVNVFFEKCNAVRHVLFLLSIFLSPSWGISPLPL